MKRKKKEGKTTNEEESELTKVKEKLKQKEAERRRLTLEANRKEEKKIEEKKTDWWKWPFDSCIPDWCGVTPDIDRATEMKYWMGWGRTMAPVAEKEMWRARRFRWFLEGVDEKIASRRAKVKTEVSG